jgi:hypothetical protein
VVVTAAAWALSLGNARLAFGETHTNIQCSDKLTQQESTEESHSGCKQRLAYRQADLEKKQQEYGQSYQKNG